MFKLPIRFLLVISLTVILLISPIAFRVHAQDDDLNDPNSNQVIVVLKDDAKDSDTVSSDMAKTHGLEVHHTYKSAVKGYSAKIPKAKLDKVKKDPRVKVVVEDREVHAFAQTVSTGDSRIQFSTASANKGSGIGVAVIDSGIDLTHPDLVKNIIAEKSCVKTARTANDDNGHGTHVAGIIAALNNTTGVVGVAPEAKLIAIKVLNSKGSGTISNIVCGIDWIITNANKYNIKVANMSLGGGGVSDNNCGKTDNDVMHQAICKARDVGITFVVAAGNDGADASKSTPAAYDDTVITVSALADSDGKPGGKGTSTSYGGDDTFASFSNFGSVVDIAAPGVSIYSTYKGGKYATLSGTSMATPFVSGAAALYIKSHVGSSWQQVRDGLKQLGEALGSGHTDPSGKHPEPLVLVGSL